MNDTVQVCDVHARHSDNLRSASSPSCHQALPDAVKMAAHAYPGRLTRQGAQPQSSPKQIEHYQCAPLAPSLAPTGLFSCPATKDGMLMSYTAIDLNSILKGMLVSDAHGEWTCAQGLM